MRDYITTAIVSVSSIETVLYIVFLLFIHVAVMRIYMLFIVTIPFVNICVNCNYEN